MATCPKRGRGRPRFPGRDAVYVHFVLSTPPNMARRARCMHCDWDRAAVFSRLASHLAAKHSHVVAPGNTHASTSHGQHNDANRSSGLPAHCAPAADRAPARPIEPRAPAVTPLLRCPAVPGNVRWHGTTRCGSHTRLCPTTAPTVWLAPAAQAKERPTPAASSKWRSSEATHGTRMHCSVRVPCAARHVAGVLTPTRGVLVRALASDALAQASVRQADARRPDASSCAASNTNARYQHCMRRWLGAAARDTSVANASGGDASVAGTSSRAGATAGHLRCRTLQPESHGRDKRKRHHDTSHGAVESTHAWLRQWYGAARGSHSHGGGAKKRRLAKPVSQRDLFEAVMRAR